MPTQACAGLVVMVNTDSKLSGNGCISDLTFLPFYYIHIETRKSYSFLLELIFQSLLVVCKYICKL